MIVGLALVGALAACSGPVASEMPGGSPAPTATVTVTASARANPTEPESDADPAAARDMEIGQMVSGLIRESDDTRKPVRERFLALIRHASLAPDGGSDRALTLTIDKVVWNEDFTDGGDEDPYLNPVVKWEKLQMPEAVVLIVPQAVPQPLTAAEFVDYVNDYGKGIDPEDVFRSPFAFYFAGDRPVALQERYIP